MTKELVEETIVKINVCLKKWDALSKGLYHDNVRSVVLTFFNKAYSQFIGHQQWKLRKAFARDISNRLFVIHSEKEACITKLTILPEWTDEKSQGLPSTILDLDYNQLNRRALVDKEVLGYPAKDITVLSFDAIRNFKFIQ